MGATNVPLGVLDIREWRVAQHPHHIIIANEDIVYMDFLRNILPFQSCFWSYTGPITFALLELLENYLPHVRRKLPRLTSSISSKSKMEGKLVSYWNGSHEALEDQSQWTWLLNPRRVVVDESSVRNPVNEQVLYLFSQGPLCMLSWNSFHSGLQGTILCSITFLLLFEAIVFLLLSAWYLSSNILSITYPTCQNSHSNGVS